MEEIRKKLLKSNLICYLHLRSKTSDCIGRDHISGELCYFKYSRKKVHCDFCNDFESNIETLEISLFKRYHQTQFKRVNFGIRAAFPHGIDYIKARDRNVMKRSFCRKNK